jgi:ribose transport system ATP-binding protein
VAGLSGSGREDVAPALAGAIAWSGGRLVVGGQAVTELDPAAAIGRGIAYLPHDRKRESAIPSFTVRENLTLPQLRTIRGGWLSLRRERADADVWLGRLGVQPSNAAERIFTTLSGGNQQKVVLARWMRCGAKILALDEPTQGVDVAAKSMIYQALTAAARQGTAIIVASSDNEELARLCDRVVVLRDGQVAAELHGSALTLDAIARQALAGAAVSS